ncbi:hypothetical protein HMPREF3214_00909 [Alloscardovia omnicolens]|nr:hypothetical protein HMPREF3214_00909 [Alloscardovia omnicolens]
MASQVAYQLRVSISLIQAKQKSRTVLINCTRLFILAEFTQ